MSMDTPLPHQMGFDTQGTQTKRTNEVKPAIGHNARVGALLRAVMEGHILIDDQGVLLAATPWAEEAFGCATACLGQGIGVLMPAPYQLPSPLRRDCEVIFAAVAAECLRRHSAETKDQSLANLTRVVAQLKEKNQEIRDTLQQLQSVKKKRDWLCVKATKVLAELQKTLGGLHQHIAILLKQLPEDSAEYRLLLSIRNEATHLEEQATLLV